MANDKEAPLKPNSEADQERKKDDPGSDRSSAPIKEEGPVDDTNPAQQQPT